MSFSPEKFELTLPAFAKINLTLDVFSKRPDGFHGVASVMQSISLHDTISIRRCAGSGIAITCSGPEAVGVPTDDSNLVVRAAAAALKVSGSSAGIEIHLTKRVPLQAGLGGGSSDAASTLCAVNMFLDLGLSRETICEIAAGLGSDVPFFLIGGTVTVRGRGEILTPITDAPELWLALVKPEENVSTAWAYTELDTVPDRGSNRGTKRMEQAIAGGEEMEVVSRLCNDFELPVFAHYPQIAWITDEMMMAGARSSRLCGSGSAVFGVAANEQDAARIGAQLRKSHAKVYCARTVTREQCQAEMLNTLPSVEGKD